MDKEANIEQGIPELQEVQPVALIQWIKILATSAMFSAVGVASSTVLSVE